jgi:hypothetical protein
MTCSPQGKSFFFLGSLREQPAFALVPKRQNILRPTKVAISPMYVIMTGQNYLEKNQSFHGKER